MLDLNKTLEFDGELPIGVRNWEVKRDYAYCKKESGYKVNLTFSQCYPNKFTCRTGHCISLEDRCSIGYECMDKTDEKDCRKIKRNEDYNKAIFPIEANEPCIIHINISINSLPDISTTYSYFTADFFLNLRWRDPRLELLDLNQDFVMNTMTKEELDEIWQPKFAFIKALGPQNPIGPMMGTLIKEDKRMEDTISATECRFAWFVLYLLLIQQKNLDSFQPSYIQGNSIQFSQIRNIFKKCHVFLTSDLILLTIK